MSYLSLSYYIAVILIMIVYYQLPARHAWVALLAGSILFCCVTAGRKLELVILFATIIISWLSGLLLARRKDRYLLWLAVLLSASPFLLSRVAHVSFISSKMSIIVPVGLAFYTLSIVGYLVDIWAGRIEPERNFFKYALFVTYFPKIIQGPITRWQQLKDQLFDRKRLEISFLLKGSYLILWGFFLKLMVADKAAVAVNPLFARPDLYKGGYVWIASVLYFIELYADFAACVRLSQGVSLLFGITLPENFEFPYIADSITDFWRRWHMTLGTWMRDYVFLPLSFSKPIKRLRRKFLHTHPKLSQWLPMGIALFVTWLLTGIWHGADIKYAFYGLYYFVLIFGGMVLEPFFTGLCQQMKIDRNSSSFALFRKIRTLLLATIGMTIFRADSLHTAAHMISSALTDFNPWVLFDGSLCRIGLTAGDWVALILSILTAFMISLSQYHGHRPLEKLMKHNTFFQWIVITALIGCIWVFGTYGYGYQAADFIYGGF